MEDIEENSEEQNVSAVYSYRSPSFTREETAILIELVNKYKIFILNKSVSSIACQAKDTMWNKIEKEFNNRSQVYERSAECLKTKWENLKRDARRVSKNVLDPKNPVYNELIEHVVTILNDNDNINTTDLLPIADDEVNETPTIAKRVHKLKKIKIKNWAEQEIQDKVSDEFIDSKDDGRIGRSMNFSPQETKLLLECVKEEKKIVFSRDCDKSSNKLKDQAWNRITDAYNRKSSRKRATKVLRTKFDNMRRLTRTTSIKDCFRDFRKKHHKLLNEPENTIKIEPGIQKDEMADDFHDDNFNDPSSYAQITMEGATFSSDPLSTVLNGDTGCSWAEMGNKECESLKIELLKYQLETAKVERQRLLESIEAERSDRETLAVERSLRLRAARLDAAAAELRLPPAHPALRYTPEEARAHHYITSAQNHDT